MRDHTTAIDECDAIAQALDLLHGMADQEDRHTLLLEPLQRRPHTSARLGVQARRELVEDDHSRASGEGERDRESLLLSTGEFVEDDVCLFGEVDHLQQLAGGPWGRVEAPVEINEFCRAQRVVQLSALQLHAEDLAHASAVGAGIQSQDSHRPLIGFAQAGQHFDRRGLPRSVRAQDAEGLARLDAQTHIIDGDFVPVTLRQPLCEDRRSVFAHALRLGTGTPIAHVPEVTSSTHDFWQGSPIVRVDRLNGMRRLGTEGWAGIVMLTATFAVSAPALFGLAEISIPRPVWAGILVVFGGGVLCSVMMASRLRVLGYIVSVGAAWVLVVTANMGLVLILLVVTAAISVYFVPLWCGLLVVALNTVVVGVVYAQQGQSLFEVTMMVGFYALIQLATVFSTATLVREQKLRAELAVAHVELQAASVLLSESARTAERLRISRDLHDLIGHQLTALTLQLETARHVEGAVARRHIDDADTVARALLQDVRATVGRLRTQPTDLEEELARIGDGIPGLTITVDVAEDVRSDEQVGIAFVRAMQEVITNAVRHADAKEVWVEITTDHGYTTFVARDDGVGAVDPVLGNGLRGLRERFGELGGTLEIDGSSGFCVTARVPFS